MKNIIEFYYNLSPENIKQKNNNYYFNTNNNNYIFKEYNINIALIEDIAKLNIYLNNYLNINKIIFNKYNNPLTKINSNYYILILQSNKINIDLATISKFSSISLPKINTLERNNWQILWSNMIDYYETQIGENSKKYPLFVNHLIILSD